MSVLNKTDNIALPYPTEGVVRTAQLDDTVAPSDSAQLAVNMNFDRVGAFQTRPGVSEYADTVDGPIRNFGTLNNSEILDGYDNLQKMTITNTFEDGTDGISISKIDDTHFIVFWSGASDDGFAQVVEVDPDSGIVTRLGSPLEFDTTNNIRNTCLPINQTSSFAYFINFWTGTDNDGFVRAFRVSKSTWAVTAMSTALEFETVELVEQSIAQIDSNHFTCFYAGDTNTYGYVSNFEVNLTTYAVTEVGTRFEFESNTTSYISIQAIGNGTHVLAFWSNGTIGKAQTFLINTSTWNTSAVGTALTYNANAPLYNSSISLGDGEHFVNSWANSSLTGYSRVFNVNPSTFAVTTASTLFDLANRITISSLNINISTTYLNDGEHYALFFYGKKESTEADSSGYAQIFSVDPTTKEISTSSNLLKYGTISVGNASAFVSTGKLINFWSTSNSNPGDFVNSLFDFFGNIQKNNYLYLEDGNNDILNWDGSTWTVRRTGLRSSQKARFAQYLNYIWMVNGGIATGDPVATSNGGDFGTALVPTDFPQGDFISAGFEGRVWVADSVTNTIYYSDIVQFVPPFDYSLDYNPEVNFISNISPQTGQSITGLFEVPRALLVFTQDSIFRIYGATSLDAYPAYNVGTYSQESIIRTKTGIFFHHSSGFYQFDYGSQPIEISRRIIDFVEAIPRTYYENIVGVYDGFDAVKWYVGPVTVEGVTFSNCVLRYTLSTQVWTVYDYVDNVMTAMITYDDGTTLNQVVGTSEGLVGALDTGTTDFGEPFYFEYIDRWRAFGGMYYQQKNIGSINIYSENAGGTNIMYQVQKSGPNVWEPIGTITDANNCIIPTTDIGDFDVIRFRIAGTTSGTPVVVHGIEVLELTTKGQDLN